MGTDEKTMWCCANKGLGCPGPAPGLVVSRDASQQYNCYSTDGWTDEKREWCCANKDRGCLVTLTPGPPAQYNCYSKDVRDSWTDEKKDWCCTNNFWTDEKREWCCANKDRGCLVPLSPGPPAQYNCYSKDVRDPWTAEKKDWCCTNNFWTDE